MFRSIFGVALILECGFWILDLTKTESSDEFR